MQSEIKLLIAFYASLAIGAVLLGWLYFFGPTQQRYTVFVGYMSILTLALNSRYFIDGPIASISFFTGVYDVSHNFAADNVTTVSLIPCEYLRLCASTSSSTLTRITKRFRQRRGGLFYFRRRILSTTSQLGRGILSPLCLGDGAAYENTAVPCPMQHGRLFAHDIPALFSRAIHGRPQQCRYQPTTSGSGPSC